MTKLVLAIAGVVLLAAGAVLRWLAFREEPAVASGGLDGEIAALRATLSEQSARIERLEKSGSGAVEAPRLRATLDEQAARIARLEGGAAAAAPDATAPANSAERAAKALAELQSITDGSRTIAIADAVAALVRAGEASVPGIASLLDSGLDRDYGGRMPMQGNAVTSYPSLRMALFDALRQIGSPAARQAVAEELARSDRLADFQAVSLFWRYGTELKDPALVAAFSALASTLARKVADEGLETTVCDADTPVFSVLYWLTMHPSPDDAPAVERIVLRGHPKSGWGARVFETAFRTLAQLAPEKAVQATQSLRLDPWETVQLSSYLAGPRANQVRYYDALFAQTSIDARAREQLYSRMPRPDDRIKDAAQRAADIQPIVAFLESRVAAETDARAKAAAEQALTVLREALR